jgi:hypothetical protein
VADAGAPDAGDASAVGVLDCAWLASSDSCFHASIAGAAQDCPIVPQGILSADGTKCTFPNGAVVTFATPYSPVVDASVPDFSIDTDGGGPCLSVAFLTSTDGYGWSIATRAGTTSVAVQTSTATVTLTCPDGARHVGAGASLDPCVFPGISIAGPDPLGIALAGAGGANDTPLFTCRAP